MCNHVIVYFCPSIISSSVLFVRLNLIEQYQRFGYTLLLYPAALNIMFRMKKHRYTLMTSHFEFQSSEDFLRGSLLVDINDSF